LLAKWRPEKPTNFCILLIAAFLDRNLWIKQTRALFVESLECLKLLKAIKVVEKVLKAFFESNDVLPNDE
jgi:hypothetical protein